MEAYAHYREEFGRLAEQARIHFQARDWAGLKSVAEERLLLYPRRVTEVVVELAKLSLWNPLPPDRVRGRYAAAIESLPDAEIAMTFYNSVIRRLLGTVGVDHATEFLDLSEPSFPDGAIGVTHRVPDAGSLPGLLAEILDSARFTTRWEDRSRDVRRIVGRLTATVPEVARGAELVVLPRPFLRNTRAFLVARLTTSHRSVPLVISLVNPPAGLAVETALLTEDDASIVFGFSRSYFQVDVESPREWVGFLHSLLPTKRYDELYTVLGYYKHGKREFYQQLQRLLAEPGVQFEPAEGVRGMVMLVFAMKQLNSVFKVIKDRPDPPKVVSRREVAAKYRYVFLHEHGGRLADSQEFEGLAIPRRAFAPAVLTDLLTQARDTVKERGDQLVFSHLYTERRMTPLDVYLRQADPEQARAAVLDFGQAIKDLASLNIFPGDMLTKNFGVTRHGRLVFYDYDEICPVTSCVFRSFPRSQSDEDEMAAEPWFPVREGDMFPEEWERFLRFPAALHREFLAHHGDLFSPEWWNGVLERLDSGEIIEPAPFSPLQGFDR